MSFKDFLIFKISRVIPDFLWIELKFITKYGRWCNLRNPKTYDEKLQWLKLNDRKPIYTEMVDKYSAKKLVANCVGEKYVIPVLGCWEKFDDIDFDSLPQQFVLKCTHDSGGLVVCRDKDKLDKQSVKKRIESRLKINYFYYAREWPYKNVKPRIIAEEYIQEAMKNTSDIDSVYSEGAISTRELQQRHGLLDYKFMCFNGNVKALFLDIGVIGDSEGHAEEYYRNVYDREFKLLPVKETRNNYPQPIIKPEQLDEMIKVAERISKGIPHLRVDLYCINDNVYVGEMTFYHGSGLANAFDPPEWDVKMGEWISIEEIKK